MLPPRPNLFDFHGVSMVNIFTSNWENIQNFQARPDDILIATYPKAGLCKIGPLFFIILFHTVILFLLFYCTLSLVTWHKNFLRDK